MSRTDLEELFGEDFGEFHPMISLVESSDSVFWITNQNSDQLLYISPAAGKVFGREPDDLIADPNWRVDLMRADDHPEFKEAIADLVERENKTQLYRINSPNGEASWVEDRIQRIPLKSIGNKSNANSSIGSYLIGGIATDVTARVAEAKRLTETQFAFRSFADAIPFQMMQKDMLGRIVYANKSYCEMAGKSLDELLGKTNFDLFPAELARKYTRDDQQVLSEGKLFRDVEQHLRPDGSSAHIETFKAPIFDNSGEMIGFNVMFRDVSETKEVAKAYDLERHLLHTLLQNVPDNIYFKDDQSNFIRISNSHAEKFQLSSPDEAVGLSDADFFPDEDQQVRNKDEQALIRGEVEIVVKEESEEWKKGEETWVHTTKLPLRDLDGKIVGTFGISRDITDRKLIEADLERERDRLKTIIDNVPDLIFVKDRAGRFINGNTALVKALERKSLNEVVGKTDFDFWPPEHACNYVADDQIVMRSGTPSYNKEESSVDKYGNEVWLLTSKVPLFDANGEVTGLVGIGRDITKSRKANEQLSAAKDLADAANRAKSDFLANMSHEIRTPMNAIIGMTELLMDTKMNQTQHDYLQMIQGSGESLLSVINDILDFSKIEAGKLELDAFVFDVCETLGDTMKSLAMRAHVKKLELAFRVQPAVPRALYGDAGRFRQVIVNLVGNAIKFTEIGEVVVDVGISKVTREETSLLIKVRDTGIGIPADVCEHIFDEFQQADTSTTRRYGGTGLGLAISSRLVKLMGGRIWVKSRTGRGSEFQFTVKFENRDAKELVHVPVIVGGTRVLVVDDNDTNRLILKEMLNNWGMIPVEADSAKKAIEVLHENVRREEPIQLIISDVHMPDVDGFTLAQWIRDDRELERVPIIMLTSGGRHGDNADRKRLNIAVSLMKPAKQSEVFDAIVCALGVNTVEDAPAAQQDKTQICRPLRVLLAEDNPVNQKLAITVLEKHNHTVEVANNGREAIEMTANQTYDLVLMDVQMPEMDGLNATRKIREREIASGMHQKIIAMTANAMKGDRETCIESGMDDYLSKPIRIAELNKKLIAWFGLQEQPAAKLIEDTLTRETVEADSDDLNNSLGDTSNEATAIDQPKQPEQSPQTRKHVDWHKAKKHVGGNDELLKEIVELFLEELPGQKEELKQAVRARNGQRIKGAAHSLKGSMLFLSTHSPYQTAFKIEHMGAANELEYCSVEFEILQRLLTELAGELMDFITTT